MRYFGSGGIVHSGTGFVVGANVFQVGHYFMNTHALYCFSVLSGFPVFLVKLQFHYSPIIPQIAPLLPQALG
jgi:hypothetical protein